jgi:hypothetical protein
MLIGSVALMGTEKRARWGDCVRMWFFRRGENYTCKRAARGCLWMPQAFLPQTSIRSIIDPATLPPSPLPSHPHLPTVFWQSSE